jgi:ferredoxin-NADP reductase
MIPGDAVKFETTVAEMIQRTHNVRSFRFPRPPSFSYKPGQFMLVTVRSGQERMRKPFSISSSPTEAEFIEFTKKLTDHPFSTALMNAKIGDWASIDGPYGNFTFEGEFEEVSMLSGGVGITPLRSICKYCTDTSSRARITLLYGNRTEEDIVFQKELEEMQAQNKNLRVVFTVDEAGPGWSGKTGIIDEAMIQDEVPNYLKNVFYVCGPPAMVVAILEVLGKMGISRRQVKVESFQGYG